MADDGPLSLEDVLLVIDSGAAAIERFGPLPPPGGTTPCGEWLAHDLIRHLEIIAGAYVLWAGSAVGGRVGRLRLLGQLDGYNRLMLERLPDRPTDSHLTRWRDLAGDHRRLVVPAFDRPMLQDDDGRILTAGQHGCLVGLEWHIHAWDLARSAGQDHVPADGDVTRLARAWNAEVAPVLGHHLSPDAAWPDVLRASGRHP